MRLEPLHVSDVGNPYKHQIHCRTNAFKGKYNVSTEFFVDGVVRCIQFDQQYLLSGVDDKIFLSSLEDGEQTGLGFFRGNVNSWSVD
jgi:hypothetical protein